MAIFRFLSIASALLCFCACQVKLNPVHHVSILRLTLSIDAVKSCVYMSCIEQLFYESTWQLLCKPLFTVALYGVAAFSSAVDLTTADWSQQIFPLGGMGPATQGTPNPIPELPANPEGTSAGSSGGSSPYVPSTVIDDNTAAPAVPVTPVASDTPVTPAGNLANAGGPGGAMQVVLDEHNHYRAKHGVPTLTWDPTVAASAQNYANGCPQGHSGGGYGENMAWGHADFASAVKAWYDEVQQYVPGSGFSSGTGHFTQLVWRDTTKLGCGVNAGCGMATYVCQYDPAGERRSDLIIMHHDTDGQDDAFTSRICFFN